VPGSGAEGAGGSFRGSKLRPTGEQTSTPVGAKQEGRESKRRPAAKHEADVRTSLGDLTLDWRRTPGGRKVHRVIPPAL
jgi:hypothetical protein